MSNSALKILFGAITVFFLIIVGILIWTKSPPPASMEMLRQEVESNEAKKTERVAYTIYILKDTYQLLPGKFEQSRKPEELIEIKDIQRGLGDYLLEGNEYVVFFKETSESEFKGVIDLLDALSANKGLQYSPREISQEEVEFLKRAQKNEAQ